MPLPDYGRRLIKRASIFMALKKRKLESVGKSVGHVYTRIWKGEEREENTTREGIYILNLVSNFVAEGVEKHTVRHGPQLSLGK